MNESQQRQVLHSYDSILKHRAEKWRLGCVIPPPTSEEAMLRDRTTMSSPSTWYLVGGAKKRIIEMQIANAINDVLDTMMLERAFFRSDNAHKKTHLWQMIFAWKQRDLGLRVATSRITRLHVRTSVLDAYIGNQHQNLRPKMNLTRLSHKRKIIHGAPLRILDAGQKCMVALQPLSVFAETIVHAQFSIRISEGGAAAATANSAKPASTSPTMTSIACVLAIHGLMWWGMSYLTWT